MEKADKKIHIETRTMVIFWIIPMAIALFALFVKQSFSGLIILFLALFLALAISPLVAMISKKIPGRSRNFATALSYIIVVGILAIILSVIVPVVVSETSKLVSGLPEMLEVDSDLWNGINSFGQNIGINDVRSQVVTIVEGFAKNFDIGGAIITGVGTIGSVLAGIVLVLVLGFLMLIEGPRLMDMAKKSFKGKRGATKVVSVTEKMGFVISKFVSGELMVALINACVTALIVFVLSMIFGFSAGLALPFGLITGVLCLVPLFGSFVGGCIVSVLILFSSPWAALIYFVIYVVYLQLEGNIIYPKVQSKGLHLPTLVVLAAITLGIYAFGLLGAIIAVPIAACVKVIIEEYTKKEEPKETAKLDR